MNTDITLHSQYPLKNIENPNLDLKLIEVLYEYNCIPFISLYRDKEEQPFIVAWYNCYNNTIDEWVILKLSEDQLTSFKNLEMTFLDVYKNNEIFITFETSNSNEQWHNFCKVELKCFPEECLPSGNAYLKPIQ